MTVIVSIILLVATTLLGTLPTLGASSAVGEEPCSDCGLTSKPSVNSLESGAQKIKDKTKDVGSNSCSPPRTSQLVGAITKSRKKSRTACQATTKAFYSSCSLLSEQTIEDRISFIADRIPAVIGEMPTQYADPRITPDLLLCVMKREDPDFDPTRISNNACNIGPSRASDFGLGQILLSTVVDYWHYYNMNSNPDFQDLVTKYKTPQNLYYSLGDDIDLQIKMMVIVMNQKLRKVRLETALRHYDNEGKGGYVQAVESCTRKIKNKDKDSVVSYLKGNYK